MDAKRIAIPLALFALVFAVAVDAAPATKKGPKLYKWTDSNGQVHFGNSIPPEYAGQGGEQLNKSGDVVKTIQAEKTPEEIAEEQKQAAAAEEAKQAAAVQAKRDRMLLGTYASVEDLKRATDDKVAGLESQVRLASSTADQLQNRMIDLNKKDRAARSAGKELDAKSAADLKKTQDELLRYQKFIVDREAEITATKDQFEKDRKRLIELRGPKH